MSPTITVTRWGLDALDVVGWWQAWDIKYWTVIGLGLFFFAILALVFQQHKDNEELRKSNQALKEKIENFEAKVGQRIERVEPTLKEESQQSKVVWALWYAGTKARADKVIDVDIPMKILLLQPNADNEALKRVIEEADTPLDEILADITFLTRRALHKKGRIQVGWLTDYIGYTLTIYDNSPTKGKNGELILNSNNAWLVRTPLDPRVGAGERTRERIYNKGKDAEKFQAYLETYKEFWTKRIKVRLRDGIPIEDNK